MNALKHKPGFPLTVWSVWSMHLQSPLSHLISKKKAIPLKGALHELLMQVDRIQRAAEIVCSIFCWLNSKSPDRSTAPSCHDEIFCLCIAPVASLSSWQQQPGFGCAGARCMLGDYMHQCLDPTQLCVLDDRRRAQVSQAQSFLEQHQMERTWSADTSATRKNRRRGIFLLLWKRWISL